MAREKELLWSETGRIAHIDAWLWDQEGSISWPEEMHCIYRVSPDTFTPTAESLLNLIHPEDRQAMQAWIRACAAGEKCDELEFRLILSDGSVRFIGGRGELKKDTGNSPFLIIGTAQDITERKQADEEFRRLGTVMNALTDAVYLVDRSSMRFTHINDAACRMRDQTREELLAVGPDGVLSVPRAEHERLCDNIIAGGGAAEPLEMLRLRNDGSEFPFEVSITLVQLDREYAISVVRDITERQQANRQLVDSEQRFRGLVEQSIAGIFVIRDGRLSYVNPSLVEILGHESADQLIGRDAFLLVAEPSMTWTLPTPP